METFKNLNKLIERDLELLRDKKVYNFTKEEVDKIEVELCQLQELKDSIIEENFKKREYRNEVEK